MQMLPPTLPLQPSQASSGIGSWFPAPVGHEKGAGTRQHPKCQGHEELQVRSLRVRESHADLPNKIK